MTPLTKQQVATLLQLVASAQSDCLDCDDCFTRLAEFAEAELVGRELPAALEHVRRHLEQCPCCEVEYRALLDGLRLVEECS